MTTWKGQIRDYPESIWNKYKPLSLFKGEGVAHVAAEDMEPGTFTEYGTFKVGQRPKAPLSIPLGLYEYYPMLGCFSPGHVNWQNKPNSAVELREYSRGKKQTSAVGVWGVAHLTDNPALKGGLGIILEQVLAGDSRENVKGRLDYLFGEIMGQSPLANQGGPSRTFTFPPFIQEVYDTLNGQAAERAKKKQEMKALSPSALSDLMFDFIYSPDSPVYRGIKIESFEMVPQDVGGFDLSMQVSMDIGGTMYKRMDAGGINTGQLDPAIITALISHNSTQNIDQKRAVLLNAVTILARNPLATFFDRTQEFPFDMDSKAELKPLTDEILDYENPEMLAGPGYGQILVKRMRGKAVRSTKFVDAMEKLLAMEGKPPRIRKIASLIHRLTRLALTKGKV